MAFLKNGGISEVPGNLTSKNPKNATEQLRRRKRPPSMATTAAAMMDEEAFEEPVI